MATWPRKTNHTYLIDKRSRGPPSLGAMHVHTASAVILSSLILMMQIGVWRPHCPDGLHTRPEPPGCVAARGSHPQKDSVAGFRPPFDGPWRLHPSPHPSRTLYFW